MLPNISNSTDDLQLTTIRSAEGKLVRVKGRVNIDSSPELRNLLLVFLKIKPRQNLIVDLTEVTYIDASGIATLLEALKIAHARNLLLKLMGLHDRLLHLFQVTGVLSLFGETGKSSSRVQ